MYSTVRVIESIFAMERALHKNFETCIRKLYAHLSHKSINVCPRSNFKDFK